jgi:putative transposase
MSHQSVSHSKLDCKYHLVFVPKGRRKILHGKIRVFLGPVFHELTGQKCCRILGGHMVQDHVHMLIEIPPKYAVSEIVSYIKGKSAIAVARQFIGRKRNFNGEALWARAMLFPQMVLKKIRSNAIFKIKNNWMVVVRMKMVNFSYELSNYH